MAASTLQLYEEALLQRARHGRTASAPGADR
jgi:hypothetical protein